MPKTVSNRECREMMRNILDRLDDRLYIDIDDDEQYLESLQPEGKILPVLLYLEAKGCLKLGISTGSHKLYKILLTDKGRTYFEDAVQARREKQVSWTQYVITTVIAVLALLLAVASFAWQVYTWNYSNVSAFTLVGTPSAVVSLTPQE